MNRKIAAFVVTLLATIGLAVSSPALAAAPKQICNTVVADDNTIVSQTCKPAPKVGTQWSHCNPTVSGNHITFFDNQGGCGSSVQMNAPAVGQCRLMGPWDNWAGSGANHARERIVLWDTSNCNGIPFLTTDDGDYVADLYAYSLGNKVTSISLGT